MPDPRLSRLRDFVPQWSDAIEDAGLRGAFDRTVGAFLSRPQYDDRLPAAQNWRNFKEALLAKGSMMRVLRLNVDAVIRSDVFSGEERMFATLAMVDFMMPRHSDVLGHLEREREASSLDEAGSYMARLWHALEVSEQLVERTAHPEGGRIFAATVHALRDVELDPGDGSARQEMVRWHARFLPAEEDVRAFILEAVGRAAPSWMPGEPVLAASANEVRDELLSALEKETKRIFALASQADERSYEALSVWRSALASFTRNVRAASDEGRLREAVRQWRVDTNGMDPLSDLHVPFSLLERAGFKTSFGDDELYRSTPSPR